jgi:hypothetical protein
LRPNTGCASASAWRILLRCGRFRRAGSPSNRRGASAPTRRPARRTWPRGPAGPPLKSLILLSQASLIRPGSSYAPRRVSTPQKRRLSRCPEVVVLGSSRLVAPPEETSVVASSRRSAAGPERPRPVGSDARAHGRERTVGARCRRLADASSPSSPATAPPAISGKSGTGGVPRRRKCGAGGRRRPNGRRAGGTFAFRRRRRRADASRHAALDGTPSAAAATATARRPTWGSGGCAGRGSAAAHRGRKDTDAAAASRLSRSPPATRRRAGWRRPGARRGER